MMDYKIAFENMDWENPGPGAHQKVYRTQNRQIRLLRLEEDFSEEDWCSSGHTGYLIAGEMQIDFQGKLISYTKGDGLFIPGGESHKHKALINKGKFAELVLFEEIDTI